MSPARHTRPATRQTPQLISRRTLSPLYGLRLRTDRLELRWPDDDEILALGRLARTGVHDPEEMPFLTPWTDRAGEPDFLEGYAAYHHGVRERWQPDDWSLDLGVWSGGELIGTQGLVGHDFERTRLVKSGSWLAQSAQGLGYGTEMRSAVLELAFHGLGALAAVSAVFEDNVASLRVCEKLGYVPDGEAEQLPRGVPVREVLMKLTRARWIDRERIPVRIAGLDACLPLFGLEHPPLH